MYRNVILRCLCLFALFLLAPRLSHARTPAASLLPEHTKGYVSIDEFQHLMAAWQQTQLGQLCQDPAMKPFVEDIWQRVRENLSETNTRLAIQLEQIESVARGEVCLAALEPEGEDTHAVVLLIDVVEQDAAVAALLRSVQQTFQARSATRQVVKVEGVSVVRYDVPGVDGAVGHQAFVVVLDGKLIATDHVRALQAVLARHQNSTLATLSTLPAFVSTQAGTQLDGGRIAPDVRWYIEPFGYARIVRSSSLIERKRGTDILKTLQNQGFSALQAVGGQVALHTGEHEILHRTLLLAPGELQLAARMLDFPNGETLAPPAWVPGNIANYLSFRWNMAEAFEASKSLVNELAGEKFFDEFLANLENDPNGPRVNVRRDLIQHLGHRVTFFSDCTHPITPRSERFVAAVEVTNTEAVAKTINQALQADPTARRQEVQGLAVWEIVNEEEDEDLTLTVEFSTTGLGFGAPQEAEPQEKAPALPNAAVAVVDGRLLISSHVEYLKEIVAGLPQHSLAQSSDYVRTSEALERLGAGHECSRIFSRSDETYHATYELIREGRMPDSESLLGKLLNRLKPEEMKGRRPQHIDGSKLPEFDVVRRYLGPAGIFTEAHDQGWTLTGCLLTKQE